MTSLSPTDTDRSYQRKLFWWLSVANFFDGFDMIALSQILPQIREEFDLDRAAAGWLFAVVNLGTVLAFFLIRKADKIGRKTLLQWSVGGYALFTALSALAPHPAVLAVVQMIARIFLITEWALSMVVITEEFPKERRGRILGLVAAQGTLGAIVCAGVAPLLSGGAFGWRAIYLVGILPLLLVAFSRRGMKETKRFAEHSANKSAGAVKTEQPNGAENSADSGVEAAKPKAAWLEIWRSPYRGLLLKLGLMWSLMYIATQNAVSFWKDFAVNEAMLEPKQAAQMVVIAAVFSTPLVFLVGPMLDRWGRRLVGSAVFIITAAGVFAAYQNTGGLSLQLGLIGAMFGSGALHAVLNAYNTELFPTRFRAQAMAWGNNALGRIAYVLSPIVIGSFATQGYAAPIALTCLGPIAAAFLLWLWFPETKAKALEELSS